MDGSEYEAKANGRLVKLVRCMNIDLVANTVSKIFTLHKNLFCSIPKLYEKKYIVMFFSGRNRRNVSHGIINENLNEMYRFR
jgi:hypothetical protein